MKADDAKRLRELEKENSELKQIVDDKELERIVAARRAYPEFIRCDNGAELTANGIRDWCRFSGAGTSYIDPGSPWQNPCVESYGSCMRDEPRAIEQFDTILGAQVLVADWREEYKEYRPHFALGMLSPAAFAGDAWDQPPSAALIAGGPVLGVPSDGVGLGLRIGARDFLVSATLRACSYRGALCRMPSRGTGTTVACSPRLSA